MGYDLHVIDGEEQPLETTYEDNRYFRRNIFGMGPLRDALAELGMGFWSNVPEYDKGWTEAQGRDWLRSTFNESPGIALHKCCSNDGWIVTALECKTALVLWERAGKPMSEAFGDDFIPFLQEAAANHGFVVW